ncbi:MAG: SulP family inorganic anion transporter [Betaproteobacteria bacterium]|nr:SulP family inorganic anion transporter [Betaproteobacteria bacterium]
MNSIWRHRGDIFGGLTAAVVALPLALAFGVASGAGALAGLWGAILVGFFAAVFGGTRQQVSGPTGPMTVVMAALLTQLGGNLAAAFAVVVLAGVLQIAFGVMRLGAYIKFVPQPVLSGFMSGIGVIIIVLQIAAGLGHADAGGEIVEKIAALPRIARDPHFDALALCALSLAVMVFTPTFIARVVPPPLLAVVLGTIAGVLLFKNAPIIGDIPIGFPELRLPAIALAEVPKILSFALILAFLGSIDSLLTSLVADSMTRTRHNSNKELIGQGIGNIAAGLAGGIPGAGATMRTLVNIRAGAVSPLSGALHAVVLLVVVLGFGGMASHIPLAVLAGILLKVGYDIIDWPYLKRAHKAPRADVVIMLTTLAITVFVDLITAVGVGIVMASLLFVSRMADAQLQSAKLAAGSQHAGDLSPEEAAILDQAQGRIVLFQVEGPLSFGSARDVTLLMRASEAKDALVVDLSAVPFIDTSASLALEEEIIGLRALGDTVILAGMREAVRDTLRRTGVFDQLSAWQISPTRYAALKAARDYIENSTAADAAKAVAAG